MIAGLDIAAAAGGPLKALTRQFTVDVGKAGLDLRFVPQTGKAIVSAIELEGHIQPVLAKLAVQTGETATFYVRQGEMRLCLFRVNSPSSLRLDVQPGTERPMDGAASAELLRLFERWPEEQPELPPLPLYTSGVTTPHVASISVPVIGHGDQLVGALSLSGPDARLTPKHARSLAGTLLAAGLGLCRSLGGNADAFYGVPIAMAAAARPDASPSKRGGAEDV